MLASCLAILIETNLNSGFSKLAHEPVVKSASLVPMQIAKSVSFAKLFAALPPRPPIGPTKWEWSFFIVEYPITVCVTGILCLTAKLPNSSMASE